VPLNIPEEATVNDRSDMAEIMAIMEIVRHLLSMIFEVFEL